MGVKDKRLWLKKGTVVKQNGWGVNKQVVRLEERGGRLKTRVVRSKHVLGG